MVILLRREKEIRLFLLLSTWFASTIKSSTELNPLATVSPYLKCSIARNRRYSSSVQRRSMLSGSDVTSDLLLNTWNWIYLAAADISAEAGKSTLSPSINASIACFSRISGSILLLSHFYSFLTYQILIYPLCDRLDYGNITSEL